jgi:hypothetical protein
MMMMMLMMMVMKWHLEALSSLLCGQDVSTLQETNTDLGFTNSRTTKIYSLSIKMIFITEY